jgi:preprotein translocase subunit SecA
LLPIVKNVHENEGHRYKRIALPYSDGSTSVLNISAGLEEAINSNGKSIIKDIEKTVSLALIDDNWKEHLRAMDELKESVQAASFEQKDPLVIYKMEAYVLFEELIHKINMDVCSYLIKGRLMIQNDRNIQEAKTQKTNFAKTKTSRTEEEERVRAAAMSAGSAPAKVETIVRQEKKVGRNDNCPCGSGKKYKYCHGLSA